MTAIAGAIAVALLFAIAGFQVLLAAGMPWGRAAYGGQYRGVVPPRMRITSVIAAALWALSALVVARRAGIDVWAPVPDALGAPTTWVIVGLLALSVILNAITRSRIERAIWLPVCVVACASTLPVALSPP